jgi:hypothetical protein
MTEIASGPALIELGISEMTHVTAGLSDLKFFLIGFVLVAARAVELHTFDLVLLLQMGLVDETHFFRKLNFVGFECVFRVAMAVGGHTACVLDPGFRRDYFAG